MNKKLNKLGIMLLVLILVLVGCKEKEEVMDPQEQVGNLDQAQENKEIVDEDTGLIYETSMELKYAESFAVDYFKDGYKVITDWHGRKTLLVPEGKETPDVKDNINIIQLPIESIGTFSAVIATNLRPLGFLDKISLVTTEIDKWEIPEIKQMMENGEITYVGKNSAPDFELIKSVNPDVSLLTTGTGHGEDETTEKLDEIGIKWMGSSIQRESHPAGRLEWVKFAGALFDKEEEAEVFFNKELGKIEELEKKVKDSTVEKKKVATTFYSGDVFYVRNKGDYEVKMYEIAGGEYIFNDLNPEKDGNTKMTPEEFYKGIEDSDILFYNNRLGPSIQSIADLIESAEYLADNKAVKEGNVWGFKPHYFQSGDRSADMLNDLYTIMSSPSGEITETEYYFLMK